MDIKWIYTILLNFNPTHIPTTSVRNAHLSDTFKFIWGTLEEHKNNKPLSYTLVVYYVYAVDFVTVKRHMRALR